MDDFMGTTWKWWLSKGDWCGLTLNLVAFTMVGVTGEPMAFAVLVWVVAAYVSAAMRNRMAALVRDLNDELKDVTRRLVLTTMLYEMSKAGETRDE